MGEIGILKNNWLTEEQLYSIIEENRLLETISDFDKLKIIKQPPLNKILEMPDYIVLGEFDGHKTIHIVEVKITATADVLLQLKKYSNAINEIIANSSIGLISVSVQQHVIARWFDSKLKPIFDDNYPVDYSFHRIEKSDDGWFLSSDEPGPAPGVDDFFCRTVVDFFGVK